MTNRSSDALDALAELERSVLEVIPTRNDVYPTDQVERKCERLKREFANSVEPALSASKVYAEGVEATVGELARLSQLLVASHTEDDEASNAILGSILGHASTLESCVPGHEVCAFLTDAESPLRSLGGTDALARLKDEATSALSRAAEAAAALSLMDFHVLAEVDWMPHASQRDEAIQVTGRRCKLTVYV